MRLSRTICVALVLLVSSACRKTQLSGEYAGLPGTWLWIGGWSDGGNTGFRLELFGKGKYRLYSGNKKIDYGRLVEMQSKLTFVSNKPFHKGYFYGKQHKIILFRNDTLSIGSDQWTDFPSSSYVKSN